MGKEVMKKLCMVVFNYYDIDSRVKRQAEYAASRGWHVDVIALKSRFTGKAKHHEHIRVFEISVEKQRAGFFRYLYQYSLFSFLSFFLVTSLHAKNRYSLIQVHTLPDFLIFSAIIPKLMGCPLLLDMHEITPEFFIYKYGVSTDHPFIKLTYFIEKLAMRFADHVLTVNEAIRELLISRGIPSSKISTVLDSTDESIFVPRKNEAQNGTFVLMYHGTLTPLYGLDLVIRSMQHLPECQRGNIEVRIAGEGPEEASLKSLVNEMGLGDSVKFIGTYPVDDMPQLINACNAGICPTTSNVLTEYSLSTKLLEYVSMGKPIIASRLKTYLKYFDESCIAYFSPGDEKELLEKILALKKDEALRDTLVKNAKERYRALSWTLVREKYYEVLTRLSGKET
ncbi:MAG: glycosyltransferase family 4 protein [Candidatus Eremiobacteraeota bacterium]|nr:glycosyltransferase family 4 protein [Candidatus Eremiobacteraeota bacterium]